MCPIITSLGMWIESSSTRRPLTRMDLDLVMHMLHEQCNAGVLALIQTIRHKICLTSECCWTRFIVQLCLLNCAIVSSDYTDYFVTLSKHDVYRCSHSSQLIETSRISRWHVFMASFGNKSKHCRIQQAQLGISIYACSLIQATYFIDTLSSMHVGWHTHHQYSMHNDGMCANRFDTLCLVVALF